MKKLEIKAKKLRQDTFKLFISKGEAHLGGSFSMIEAFTEVISSQEDLFGSLLFRTTSGMAIAFPKEFEGVIRPIIDVFTEPDQRLLDLKRIGQTDLNLEEKLSEKMKLQLKLWR